jgi:hypothetical protein
MIVELAALLFIGIVIGPAVLWLIVVLLRAIYAIVVGLPQELCKAVFANFEGSILWKFAHRKQLR